MSADIHTSFDHVAVAAKDDPFPEVNALREGCPVAHSDAHDGFWILSRYADVTTAAADPERFCSRHGVTIPHHGFPITLPPIESDPPEHKQFRTPIRPHLGLKAMTALEPDIRACITGLIDGFIERGEADLAGDLAIPLPAIMVTRLLNLPEEDRDRFRDWAVRILSVSGDMDVVVETMTYFAELRQDRIDHPQDDIPTMMLGIECEGEAITEVQYLCMMNVLFTAGLDTTSHMAAHTLEFLARNPEHRQRLIDEPAIIPQAIEELLRYITPLPGMSRTTTTAVEVDGQTIDEGQRVMLYWLGANHDPEQFEDPETVDFDRRIGRHMAFGDGPHSCLGRHLARIELKVLLEEVLTRLPDYAIAGDIRRTGGVTRGLDSLPVTFAPGPRKV